MRSLLRGLGDDGGEGEASWFVGVSLRICEDDMSVWGTVCLDDAVVISMSVSILKIL